MESHISRQARGKEGSCPNRRSFSFTAGLGPADVTDLARVPRPSQRGGRRGARSAGPVRHAGLPRAVGRADAAPARSTRGASTIRGEVDEPRSLDVGASSRRCRASAITVDIHCVTKWSKLDTSWRGVSLDTLLDGVDTSAEYVLAFSDGGYTTNLPLEDVRDGKAWVAYEFEGEPLDPEHGGPARLLVPHLYFWKSAKWVRGIELREDDTARVLGGLRLPQLRRPVERTAVRRRLTWQLARVVELRHGDRAHEEHRARCRRLAGAPRRPARRRAAHGRGRLPGAAQLLDRVGAGGRAPRAHRQRLDDGEVSPYLTETLRAGGRARAPRPDRRLLRLAGSARRARSFSSRAAPASCRCGRCCATTARSRASPRPAPLLGAHAGRPDLPRRARADYDTVDHADATSSRRSGTAARAASTPTCSTEIGWPPAERPLVYICGPTGFVEASRRRARRARPRSEPHQDGEVRPDMIAARRQRDRRRPDRGPRRRARRRDSASCASCGTSGSFFAEAVVYMRGPGRVARCRACGEMLAGARDDPRHHLRRPARHRLPGHAGLMTQLPFEDQLTEAPMANRTGGNRSHAGGRSVVSWRLRLGLRIPAQDCWSQAVRL